MSGVCWPGAVCVNDFSFSCVWIKMTPHHATNIFRYHSTIHSRYTKLNHNKRKFFMWIILLFFQSVLRVWLKSIFYMTYWCVRENWTIWSVWSEFLPHDPLCSFNSNFIKLCDKYNIVMSKIAICYYYRILFVQFQSYRKIGNAT